MSTKNGSGFTVYLATIHAVKVDKVDIRIPALLGSKVITIPAPGGAFAPPPPGSNRIIAVNDDRTQFLWVTVAGLGDGVVQANHIVSGTITALQIQANSITANEIAAGAITASELNVTTQGANLLANHSFEDANSSETFKLIEGSGAAAVIQAEITAPSSKVVQLPSTGSSFGWGFRAVPITPGNIYHVSAYIRTDVGSTGAFHLRMNWQTTSPASSIIPGFVSVNSRVGFTPHLLEGTGKVTYASATVWQRVSFQWLAPTGARWASLAVYNDSGTGTIYLDNAVVQEQFGSTFIKDGAIATNKIEALAITADKMSVNAVTSNNYSYVSGDYTAAGSRLQLDTGTFRTPGLYVNGAWPYNVSVRGDLTADNLILLTNGGTSIVAGDTSNPTASGNDGYGIKRGTTELSFDNGLGAVRLRQFNASHTSAQPRYTSIHTGDTGVGGNFSQLFAYHYSGSHNGSVIARANNTGGYAQVSSTGMVDIHATGELNLRGSSITFNNTAGSNWGSIGSNGLYVHVVRLFGGGAGDPYLTHDRVNFSDGSGVHASADWMYFFSDNTWRWRNNAGTERMFLTSSGLYLASGTFYRIYGNGGIYWENHGGGWDMTDSTYIRSYSSKAIYTNNSKIVADGASTLIAGTTSAQSTNNRGYFRLDGSGAWSESHVILRHALSFGQTAMAFHAFNVAPIIKAHNSAEAIEIRNNPDTGFAEIKASAFTVSSTLRSKIDVIAEKDESILARVRPAKQIKFRQKIRPQYLRTSERFQELDRKWQASGKSALMAKGEHISSVDHDCALDVCSGTKENPCSMTLNDTEVIGLAAEDVFTYFPEAVSLDQDGLPMGVDVAQIATSAFAAVGALLRKVEALEARLDKKV